MVKHIVLFKLREELTQAEKEDIMHRFKAAIEALPAQHTFYPPHLCGIKYESG